MKLLILGLSGSGKSSIALLLAAKYKLNLIEADDEVMAANNGVWPEGNDELIDKIFEETNQKVIGRDNILYITSWLTPERIKEFHNAEFNIIEMHADFEELLKRKNARDGESETRTERFKNTYIAYFETILSEQMLDNYLLSVDTTYKSSSQILSDISDKLS